MLTNNPFLKATPLYKEYAILEILSKDSHVSQRTIATQLDSSLSMVNQYLEEYEKDGYMVREYNSPKNVTYKLTKKGLIRLRELNINYLKSVRNLYLTSKEYIISSLENISTRGHENIIMYGAGVIADLILQILREEPKLPINVVALIDDEQSKIGKQINDIEIVSKDDINKLNFDGVLISSGRHSRSIKNNILNYGIDEDLIIDIF